MSNNPQAGSSFLRSPRTWVGVTIAVLVAAFILQNRQTVGIELLMFTFKAPLWITLSAVFVAGVATCALISRRRK